MGQGITDWEINVEIFPMLWYAVYRTYYEKNIACEWFTYDQEHYDVHVNQ